MREYYIHVCGCEESRMERRKNNGLIGETDREGDKRTQKQQETKRERERDRQTDR